MKYFLMIMVAILSFNASAEDRFRLSVYQAPIVEFSYDDEDVELEDQSATSIRLTGFRNTRLGGLSNYVEFTTLDDKLAGSPSQKVEYHSLMFGLGLDKITNTSQEHIDYYFNAGIGLGIATLDFDGSETNLIGDLSAEVGLLFFDKLSVGVGAKYQQLFSSEKESFLIGNVSMTYWF